MNYIEAIAMKIHAITDPDAVWPNTYSPLYRIYAMLALFASRGNLLHSQDIHDAWSAWCASVDPTHRSLTPFWDLSEAVQRLDDKYTDAITQVARDLKAPPEPQLIAEADGPFVLDPNGPITIHLHPPGKESA